MTQPSLNALSPRERQIFDLVIDGRKNEDIAKALNISMKTVETHRTHINRKLQAHSTADLVRFAAQNNLLGFKALPRSEGVLIEELSVYTENGKLFVAVLVDGVRVVLWSEEIAEIEDPLSEAVHLEGLRRAVSKAFTNRKAA